MAAELDARRRPGGRSSPDAAGSDEEAAGDGAAGSDKTGALPGARVAKAKADDKDASSAELGTEQENEEGTTDMRWARLCASRLIST